MDVTLQDYLIKRKILHIDPWYELINQMLDHVIKDFKGRIVLEIGCGLGGFCIYTAQKGAYVVGLDISLTAIKKAKELVKKILDTENIEFIVGDAQHLPFKNDIGEVVICSETLEHVPNSEKAFSELVRTTQKSGYLCITVPNFFSTMFLEYLVLFSVGQPKYAQNFMSVEKEHIFNIRKLAELLRSSKSITVLRISGIDLLHLPPRIRDMLKIEPHLKIISNKLLELFPMLNLVCATIGVLARKNE
jgi:ubiquinone/menaquinone biosynthesis C-methylase UbiE